jgi:DMSO/TMAO reductase YedYZ molybdopterin-dependent catalytic subunit
MTGMSRRGWIAAAAGLAGGGLLAKTLWGRGDLVPPDYTGIYGAGETLTYGASRLITGDHQAREFPRRMISARPFANGFGKLPATFEGLRARDFLDWRLVVDGLVDNPLSLSLADLQAMPSRSQITEVSCEEGWSYIAEWIGTPLSAVLERAGLQAGAKYVYYNTIQPRKWDTIDLDEAMHPQTLLTFGMNGGKLPVEFGGPLRLRVPRQLGYKSLKFLTSVTAVASIQSVRTGLGNGDPDYSWFGGI